MLYRVHLVRMGFELITLTVISADCIGSYFLYKYPKKGFLNFIFVLLNLDTKQTHEPRTLYQQAI